MNKPQVVACYTNDFVYERIAPGLFKELSTRMPKDNSDHRLFTDVFGHPALAQHLH